MIHPRLRVFGICAVALTAMAFSATAAPAETGAQWLLARTFGAESVPFLEAKVGLATETGTSWVLHSIFGLSLLFECSQLQFVNARLKENGGIGTGAQIKFSSCTTKINGSSAPECRPKTEGEEGVIKTHPLHGLIELHKSGAVEEILRLTPDTGETFVTFETMKGCVIASKFTMFGKLTFRDGENHLLWYMLEHLLEVGPLTELWMFKKSDEQKVSILGSAWAFLTGEHEGLWFRGDPA
jgi:hypothetical protein